ncbi:MAG TPA: hypothetical protein VHB51_04275 [Candidatus Saccharimonadales bacterium]|nr:hypothetical protein [Candidatus Saccharimonadales bacterium]
MSESLPETLITYVPLAEEMAYAEHPYRQLEIAAKAIGLAKEAEAAADKANMAAIMAGRVFVDVLRKQVEANELSYGRKPESKTEPNEVLERRAKLDMSIHDLIASQDLCTRGATPVRISNALKRANLYTLRDVLVVGRLKVKDIQNFGQGSINALQHAIDLTGEPWMNRPTPTDIVNWCENLDQVSGMVIDFNHRDMTVQEMLDVPVDERATAFSIHYEKNPESDDYNRRIKVPDEARAREVYGQALAFASRFTAARDRLLAQQQASQG